MSPDMILVQPETIYVRPKKVYVVFSYGDPMPITTCATAELAEQYAAALALLPSDHPLHTMDAQIDEVPLNWTLPESLAGAGPETEKT